MRRMIQHCTLPPGESSLQRGEGELRVDSQSLSKSRVTSPSPLDSSRLSRREGEAWPKRPRQRSGTVLLIVAVIVMLLSLAAYKFMLSMQIEHIAASISGDRIQTQQSAYSARDLLVVMLESSREQRAAMGGLKDNPVYFGGSATALNAGFGGSSSLGSSYGAESSSVGGATSGSSLIPETPFGTIGYALPVSSDAIQSTNQNSISSVTSETKLVNGQLTQTSTDTASDSTTTNLLGSPGPPTRYGVKNESARLHLFKLLEWESKDAGAGVAALMQLPGMEVQAAESILDWLDEDDDPRESGAESEFYSRLTRPLMPRNALPPDLDELLFVRGVDAFRLFGIRGGMQNSTLTNALGANPLSSTTSSFGEGSAAFSSSTSGSGTRNDRDSELQSGPLQPWAEFLTVYSAERNETYTGEPRMFINGKQLEALHRELLKSTSDEVANFLVLYRQFGPSGGNGGDEADQKNDQENDNEPDQETDSERESDRQDVADSSAEQGDEETESADSITITFEQEAKFGIGSMLDLIGITITIPSENEDEKPKLVHSPFGEDESEITPEFVRMLDSITLNAVPRIVGRINVNEAPAEVLMMLPGMTVEIVEAILMDRKEREEAASRSSTSIRDEADERQHPIWLLTEGVVDLETMRQLWPHVTCGGDVFRAEVWGYTDEKSPTFRFETVLDASTKKCRPVYYRELSAPKNSIRIKASAEEIAAASGDEASGFGESRRSAPSFPGRRDSGAEAF